MFPSNLNRINHIKTIDARATPQIKIAAFFSILCSDWQSPTGCRRLHVAQNLTFSSRSITFIRLQFDLGLTIVQSLRGNVKLSPSRGHRSGDRFRISRRRRRRRCPPGKAPTCIAATCLLYAIPLRFLCLGDSSQIVSAGNNFCNEPAGVRLF